MEVASFAVIGDVTFAVHVLQRQQLLNVLRPMGDDALMDFVVSDAMD